MSAINWLLISLVTFWAALRLFAKKDFQLRIFSVFFFLFSLFMFIMTAAHFVLLFSHLNHEIFRQSMHWGFVIGHIFLYLSLAVFIRLPLDWIAAPLKNIGSAFFILFGGITTVLNFLLPNLPEYSHSTGITLLNVDPLVGKLIALNVVLAWVPAGIYFIIKGARGREKNARRRAMLLGIGLFIATLGGPLHDVSRQVIAFLVADIVVLAGIVILASGVMYQKEEAQA